MRTAWNWSLEEMSATLNVDRASISFWEWDESIPSGPALVSLCEFAEKKSIVDVHQNYFNLGKFAGQGMLGFKLPINVTLPCDLPWLLKEPLHPN